MQKSKLQLKNQKFFSSSTKNTWDFADKIFKNLASLERDKAVVLALKGQLGAGKTTFAQGILKAAGAKGPFTSPTFVIMKQYRGSEAPKKGASLPIFHFDCYRVGSKDILELGWEEIISNPENLVLVEWPEKIKDILPTEHILVEFKAKGENRREIGFNIK